MTVHVKLNGRQVKAKARRGLLRGIGRAARHVLGVSNRRVPIDEGTLRNSGTVIVDRDEMAAVIYYDTVYARRQHEELTWRHEPGRRAKFLESSLDDEQDTVRDIVAGEVEQEFRQGGSS